MLEKLIDIVFTEYGVFVTFLVLTVLAEGFVIKILWDRNKFLGDKIVDIIESNVRVLTILEERINASTQNDNSG